MLNFLIAFLIKNINELIFDKMSPSGNKIRLYYGFIISSIVFQLILWGLLNKLSDTSHYQGLEILEVYKALIVRLDEKAELDDSGNYKILYSENGKNKEDVEVTLVTQCSTDHMFLIDDLMNVWDGPISIAVFSDAHNVEETLWEMARYNYCYNLRELELHLVVYSMDYYLIRDFQFGYRRFFNFDKSQSCGAPQILDRRMDYIRVTPYPVNLLRNVAKRGSSSEYILLIDIDIVPSPNLMKDFLNFTKYQSTKAEKVVYVAPVFEVPLNVPVPKTKSELMKRVKNNEARPFYFQPCRNCQKLTRYGDWLLSEPTTGARILYEVEWKHPWEPFFIANRTVPDFDERFKQYGMNRVSQICELHVAGYKFMVLDNVFLVHKGFKDPNKFHPTKNKEMILNRRIYTKFKSELAVKYPDSFKSC